MKHYLLTPKVLERIAFLAWGLILSSIPLLWLVFGYAGGDLNLFEPIALKHKLPYISWVIHLAIGVCILLGPSRRRLFGAVALVLIMMACLLGLYFTQRVDKEIYTPLLPIVGILYFCGLEGIPALYLLITGYRGKNPVAGELPTQPDGFPS